jgi:glycosyltransferase involved in cell wall biosynthesis
MRKTLLSISPVVWNFFHYREQELPTQLAARGYECIFLNPFRYRNYEKGSMRLQDFSHNSIPQGIRVVERISRLKKSVWLWLLESRDNVRQIKEHRPAVVIASDHLMSVKACRYCKRHQIPFIFDITDDWSQVDRGFITRRYWKYFARPQLLKHAFAITSSSHTQAQYFQKKNVRVQVIPNGKSMAYIRESEAYKGTSGPQVNFIATLRDWYDFELLFDLFSHFPKLQLNIYGDGPLKDKLRRDAAKYANICIHGSVEPAEVPKLTAASLFGILPLKQGALNQSTCPIKLFEYWSAAKTVIAPPMNELQLLGSDCLLFASEKNEYLAQIEKIIKDPALNERLGNIGFQKMLMFHNYEHITDQFESIFSQPWQSVV